MNETSRSSGFTLVELLVATTLLALLSAALFGGLHFGARAWESGADQIEESGEIEAVQELLRRTLLEAAEAGEEAGSESMAGSPDHLSFFAPLPRHVGIGGIGRYRLALDEQGRMLLSWEPRRPDLALEERPSGMPAAILANVGRVAIAYFGAEEGDQAPAWRDRWSGVVLPLLIRIDVQFREDDPRRWPELVIAPRLARPAEG